MVDVIRSMSRRWYILAAVALLAVLSVMALYRDAGVYTTRTVVAFTFPGQSVLLSDSGIDDVNLIGFAGAIAQEINDGRPAQAYASADAPYYGAGVREGVLVSLPDSGGQWVTNYAHAQIEIQIVGRSYDWVKERQGLLLARISELAQEQQTVVDVSQSARLTPTVMPLTTEIDRVEPGLIARVVAIGSLAMAAALVAGWASLWIDRVGADMRRRRMER